MTKGIELSPEAEREVVGIVLNDLTAGFGDAVEFKKIRIVPGEDIDGEPYHHIVVVYSGDGELLDPAWLNGFKRRNWERLAECGIHITTESYVDELEYWDRLDEE